MQKELKSHYERIPFAMAGNLLFEVFEQIVAERNFLNRKFDEDKISKVSDDIIDELINIQKPKQLVVTHQVQDFYINTFKDLIAKHFGDSSDKNVTVEILHNYSEAEKSEFGKFINNIKSSFKKEINAVNTKFTRANNELNEINKKLRLAEEKLEDPLAKADREKKQSFENEYVQIQQRIGAKKNEKEKERNLITKNKKEITCITDKLQVSKEKAEY